MIMGNIVGGIDSIVSALVPINMLIADSFFVTLDSAVAPFCLLPCVKIVSNKICPISSVNLSPLKATLSSTQPSSLYTLA